MAVYGHQRAGKVNKRFSRKNKGHCKKRMSAGDLGRGFVLPFGKKETGMRSPLGARGTLFFR